MFNVSPIKKRIWKGLREAGDCNKLYRWILGRGGQLLNLVLERNALVLHTLRGEFNHPLGAIYRNDTASYII